MAMHDSGVLVCKALWHDGQKAKCTFSKAGSIAKRREKPILTQLLNYLSLKYLVCVLFITVDWGIMWL